MNQNHKKEYENYIKCLNKKCKKSFDKYRELVKTKMDSGKNILDLGEDPEIKESLKLFTMERDKVCRKPFLKYQTALKNSLNVAGVNHNNSDVRSNTQSNLQTQKKTRKTRRKTRRKNKTH
jgi:hypothetical protein